MAYSLKSSDIHLKNVVLYPLHEQSNYIAIQTFLELVKTSIGPYGRLKSIRNVGGGHLSVTSSSSRIFHLVSIKNTFLRFLAAAVNSHLCCCGNGGLLCSIFSSLLLKYALDLELQDSLVANLNDRFGKMFTELLVSPNNGCVFNISFANLLQLRSVVYSIISSKPACLFTEIHRTDITLLLLRSFIKSIPSEESQSVIPHVSFFSEEGLNPSESRLLDGILLHCPTVVSDACIKHCLDIMRSGNSLKIALFATSLAGDADFPSNASLESDVSVWDEVLSYLKARANDLIANDVDILLCQRVVHPSIKIILNNHNILVIDRLGIENTQRVQLMTGAVTVSSLSESVSVDYGYCTKFETLKLGKRSYILLQNASKPLVTIFVCNSNEEALAETKAVCKQAMDTLYRLLKDPKVCCGAGCVEVHTAQLLKRSVMVNLSQWSQEIGCTSNQILEALQNFMASLEDYVVSIHQASKLSFVTETVHGHLWEIPDNSISSEAFTCKCGKFTSQNIHDFSWCQLRNSPLASPSEDIFFKESDDCIVNEPKIIDELFVKINAFKVAIQVSSSLLKLGLSITS